MLQEIREQMCANTMLSAANFTVMAQGLSTDCSSEDLRSKFSRHGRVLHVGLALSNRELILNMQQYSVIKLELQV